VLSPLDRGDNIKGKNQEKENFYRLPLFLNKERGMSPLVTGDEFK
jgi:hypothetical protein